MPPKTCQRLWPEKEGVGPLLGNFGHPDGLISRVSTRTATTRRRRELSRAFDRRSVRQGATRLMPRAAPLVVRGAPRSQSHRKSRAAGGPARPSLRRGVVALPSARLEETPGLYNTTGAPSQKL